MCVELWGFTRGICRILGRINVGVVHLWERPAQTGLGAGEESGGRLAALRGSRQGGSCFELCWGRERRATQGKCLLCVCLREAVGFSLVALRRLEPSADRQAHR